VAGLRKEREVGAARRRRKQQLGTKTAPHLVSAPTESGRRPHYLSTSPREPVQAGGCLSQLREGIGETAPAKS
jgi:hypothetical protein